MEKWIPNFQSLTDADLAAMARTSSDFAGVAGYVLELRREIGDLGRRLRDAGLADTARPDFPIDMGGCGL